MRPGRDTPRRGQERSTGRADAPFDRTLEDLPEARRWQEWLRRIEAVLFASASPVPREHLARVVGDVSVDLLIADLAADLEGRSFEVTQVAGGWMLRTRPAHAAAIRAAADVSDQDLGLRDFDVAVLGAIAYHQPITRDGLNEIFGKEIPRDLMARLQSKELVANGPRAPRAGAPLTYVTTERFLAAFDLLSLQDLPEP